MGTSWYFLTYTYTNPEKRRTNCMQKFRTECELQTLQTCVTPPPPPASTSNLSSIGHLGPLVARSRLTKGRCQRSSAEEVAGASSSRFRITPLILHRRRACGATHARHDAHTRRSDVAAHEGTPLPALRPLGAVRTVRPGALPHVRAPGATPQVPPPPGPPSVQAPPPPQKPKAGSAGRRNFSDNRKGISLVLPVKAIT